jgi:hypothetical protein
LHLRLPCLLPVTEVTELQPVTEVTELQPVTEVTELQPVTEVTELQDSLSSPAVCYRAGTGTCNTPQDLYEDLRERGPGRAVSILRP